MVFGLLVWLVGFLKTGFLCVAQAGLELRDLWPLPPALGKCVHAACPFTVYPLVSYHIPPACPQLPVLRFSSLI